MQHGSAGWKLLGDRPIPSHNTLTVTAPGALTVRTHARRRLVRLSGMETLRLLRPQMRWARARCDLIVALLVAVANSNPARAQSATLHAVVERIRVGADAPGAIVGIRHADGRMSIAAAGLSDLATGTPMTEAVPFYVGSVTKTWTAAVVMRLVEEGRLALSDTIGRFFPRFPEGGRITIEQLLNHTSGLKDFYSYLYFRPKQAEMLEYVTKRWSEPELIALSSRFGRWFAPGEDWSYSSTGYYLLGVVIERLTGTPLAVAFERYTSAPLALRQT